MNYNTRNIPEVNDKVPNQSGDVNKKSVLCPGKNEKTCARQMKLLMDNHPLTASSKRQKLLFNGIACSV